MPDVVEPLLAEVVFLREYRCFKRARKIKFQAGVTLLVGEQGCGKSSLLASLVALGSQWDHERKDATARIKPTTTRACKIASFDFEAQNPRTMSHIDDRMGMFQIASMRRSHGETVLALLDGFCREMDRASDPYVVLLDEPDMALSPRSAHLLVQRLEMIVAGGNQVIAAVHNPIVIASQPRVLSLEHKRWMTSQAFLADHAAAVAV